MAARLNSSADIPRLKSPSRRNRFRDVEQPETAGAFGTVEVRTARRLSATAVTAVTVLVSTTTTTTTTTTTAAAAMAAASAAAASAPTIIFAASARLSVVGRGLPDHSCARIGLDFGREHGLVMTHLVGIDLTVMIGVEEGEEAIGVELHFVRGQGPSWLRSVWLNQSTSPSPLGPVERNGSPIGLRNGRPRRWGTVAGLGCGAAGEAEP